MNRPNILFIVDDQHRHDYVGCAGASFVSTPHIDSIAASGVRFTQCITNSPLCVPARIGLATGMLPSRLGCMDNNCYLPQSATTFYQRLRDADYRVGCVGKLDLAKPDPYNGRYGDRPSAFRFGFTHPEECEGKMHAGGSATPIGPYTFYLEEQGLLERFHEDYDARAKDGWVRACHDSVLPTEAFEDCYIGRRSAEWVDRVPDDFPWCLFVSFVGPHDPFDPPTEYADRYRGKPMPPTIPAADDGRPTGRTVALSEEEVAETRRQYCAAITAVDDQVGAILDAVKRRGMEEETVVVFASDHGEMLGDHGGHYQKSSPYEGAIRVPLMVAGAGIEGGRTSDALVELSDLNPTVCDLAGLDPQPGIDAQSIAGVLKGEADAHREVAVSELGSFRVARTATHKLVDYVNGPTMLFNLEDDPDEQVDRRGEERETVRGLRTALRERYLKRR